MLGGARESRATKYKENKLPAKAPQVRTLVLPGLSACAQAAGYCSLCLLLAVAQALSRNDVRSEHGNHRYGKAFVQLAQNAALAADVIKKQVLASAWPGCAPAQKSICLREDKLTVLALRKLSLPSTARQKRELSFL